MMRTGMILRRAVTGVPCRRNGACHDDSSRQTRMVIIESEQELHMQRVSKCDFHLIHRRSCLRQGHTFVWMIGWLAIALLSIAIVIGYFIGEPPSESLSRVNEIASIEITTGNRLVAEASPSVAPAAAVESGTESQPTIFATHIRRPSGPPLIELEQADPQGRVGKIACSTCHSVREPNLANRKPSDLKVFHQGMPMAHGELACYSCHNPSNADALHLADGTSVSYPDVMTLCSQCHGPQARDYAHGAHGGMNGFWDLTRGPRQRNNCVDCHDPHVPKFPSMQPTFKPRDRFLDPTHRATGPVHEQFSSEDQAHE